jgi:ATP-dependent DNA ligase
LIFYASDLLPLDGKDRRDQPLLEWRTELKELLGSDRISPLQFSEEFITPSGPCSAQARTNAAQSPGRSKTWLKSE